jgi:putative tryptophan/tyrosine transport system substrate-binding protein
VNRRALILSAIGALAGPVAPALAQPAKPRRLGVLLLGPLAALTEPFYASLNDRGWSVGRNLQVETRATAGEQQRAPEMAAEMIRSGAEILVTVSSANAVAARRASSTVPIVMLASGYPVESALAASLARPGGNVTGLSIYAGTEVFGKYIGLLKEAVPKLRELGIFWGYAPPAFPEAETELCVGEMRRAAEALKMTVRVWMNPDEGRLENNLASAATAPLDALFVSAGGAQSTAAGIARVAAFCEKRRLPTMCDVAGNFFHAGGVLSYSVDFRELGVRGASFVDRILRGAKPGELPIEQPTRFELVVNLKRAKAIGLAIPPSILARADRVIE